MLQAIRQPATPNANTNSAIVAPGKIFEHANGFPVGKENTDRRPWFQEKIEQRLFLKLTHGMSAASSCLPLDQSRGGGICPQGEARSIAKSSSNGECRPAIRAPINSAAR